VAVQPVAARPPPEKTEFDVVLEAFGEKTARSGVVAVVVTHGPGPRPGEGSVKVKEGISKAHAEKLKKELRRVGAEGRDQVIHAKRLIGSRGLGVPATNRYVFALLPCSRSSALPAPCRPC